MNKIKNYGVVICFLLFLLLPTVATYLNFFEIIETENFSKKKRPKYKFSKTGQWINNIEEYYESNFGGRSFCFNIISRIKFNIFQTSILPDRVVIGKNNWLFLGNYSQDVIKETLGATVYTKQQLNEIKSYILRLEQFCKNNNIALYILIAPNRHSICESKLPFQIKDKPIRKVEQIKEISNSIIDLNNFFIKQENREKYFFAYNSHWNLYGAAAGYNVLMDSVQKKFAKLNRKSISNFIIDTTWITNKSLSRRLDLNLSENYYTINESSKQSINTYLKKDSKHDFHQLHFENRNAKNHLKLIMYRDSFGSEMVPFVSETFYSTKFLWTEKVDFQYLKKEKPDILVIECVERLMDNLFFD